MATEIINWIPVTESLPDDDMNVLMFMPGASDPVWPGYMCIDKWRGADGMPAIPQPTHWAQMPEGPTP